MVFDDVDIEDAARGVAFGAFVGSGQTCICGSRLLVQRSIHDEFVDALVEVARSIRIGDPFDPSTQLGPLISGAARERVLGYVELGAEEGGEILAGGGTPDVAGLEGGFFVEPTVITGLTNASRCAREEIFGPVAVVVPFEDEERRGPSSQRLAVRARVLDLDPRRRPSPPCGRAFFPRHRVGERSPSARSGGPVGRRPRQRHGPRRRLGVVPRLHAPPHHHGPNRACRRRLVRRRHPTTQLSAPSGTGQVRPARRGRGSSRPWGP